MGRIAYPKTAAHNRGGFVVYYISSCESRGEAEGSLTTSKRDKERVTTRRGVDMAQFIEAINRMSVAERMQVLEYLCTSLSPYFAESTPTWHEDELRRTEDAVAAGEDEFMSLEESKRLYAEQMYAH